MRKIIAALAVTFALLPMNQVNAAAGTVDVPDQLTYFTDYVVDVPAGPNHIVRVECFQQEFAVRSIQHIVVGSDGQVTLRFPFGAMQYTVVQTCNLQVGRIVGVNNWNQSKNIPTEFFTVVP